MIFKEYFQTIKMKTLLASTAGLLFAAAAAFGHGSMADPISRTYQGFLENPQSPQSNAVLAAIAVGGTQAFYDWNEVSRNILDYDYQAAIPDGQIPGAGRKKYAGLNLARTDWPATMVVAGPRACRFYTTTPHDPSFFKAYMTRDGYDPNLPLTWADLMEIPGAETATLSGPCNESGDACHCGTGGSNYYMTLQFPQRVGRHVLFVAWQRIDPNAEVFFSTSDVDFGGVDYGAPPPPPTISAIASFSITEQWNGGGQGIFRVTNNTQQPIQGWTLEFDWVGQISNVWNGSLISQAGTHYVVKNVAYNGTIAPGGIVDIGCVATFATTDPLPMNVIAFGSSGSILPIISSPGKASAAVGEFFTYQITSTGTPTSFSATGLPDGLSVNADTGIVSGVPTTASLCVASIRATNANGTGVKLLTLTVLPCQGDGNSDGVVDGVDLINLLNQWGQGAAYDLNNDGVVSSEDLTILLQGWGTCQ